MSESCPEFFPTGKISYLLYPVDACTGYVQLPVGYPELQSTDATYK